MKLKDELVKDVTRLEVKVHFSVRTFLFFRTEYGEVKLNTKELQYKNYVSGEV